MAFILTQLNDGSHLEFCQLGFLIAILHRINFTHSFWLKVDDGSHLEFCHAWIQPHGILDSDTLLSSLRFTQKHSHSIYLTLNQISWCKFLLFLIWYSCTVTGLKTFWLFVRPPCFLWHNLSNFETMSFKSFKMSNFPFLLDESFNIWSIVALLSRFVHLEMVSHT